jgi:hypothetical protein
MKKIYPAILSLFTVFSVNAQLTQANHAPVHNDMYATYQCDSVNPGAGGANTVWNYSTIGTHSSVVKSYTAQTVSTPNFPLANIAVASGPNNTLYYNSTSAQLSYYGGNISVGSGATAVIATLTYTSPAIYASYPMSFNTTASSAVGGSLNVSSPLPATGTFTGNSTTLAEGTGTLILPGTGYTYTNVLRVVNSQSISFSTGLGNGTLVQHNYEYYSPGFKEPVFTVSTATAVTPVGTVTQTLTTRNKNGLVTTVGLNENKGISLGSVSVFPNPATAQLNFVTDIKDAKQAMIYDVTGKLVEFQNFNDGKIKLDVSSYNKGLYFYTVTGNNNQKLKSGKITVSQ